MCKLQPYVYMTCNLDAVRVEVFKELRLQRHLRPKQRMASLYPSELYLSKFFAIEHLKLVYMQNASLLAWPDRN
jgi:hypothetical protein